MSKQGPTLATIKMVEEALKNMPGSVMKIPELKKALPKQVNHNVLIEILEYLEEKNNIVMSIKGITWLNPLDDKLKNIYKTGLKL